MVAQAQAEAPNECCGMFAGTIVTQGQDRIGRVLRHYPLVNAAASPMEYLSEPKSMVSAVRDLTKARLDILAVYHSHPTTAPVPSKTDRQRSFSDDVMNLIVSLENDEALVRAWWLTEDSYREAVWELVD